MLCQINPIILAASVLQSPGWAETGKVGWLYRLEKNNKKGDIYQNIFYQLLTALMLIYKIILLPNCLMLTAMAISQKQFPIISTKTNNVEFES